MTKGKEKNKVFVYREGGENKVGDYREENKVGDYREGGE